MAKKKTTLTSLGKTITDTLDKTKDLVKNASSKAAPIIDAVTKVAANMPKNYNENTVDSALDYAIAEASKPKGFNFDDPNLKKYYEKLMNRKNFSFDLNGNALWNQYKDHYTKLGQMAMADTIGQSSALTGGYGNSWAQSAGQQSYQQNLENLNNIIPELYQLALQQYQAEGDELLNRYSVASGERDFAYGQYRDSVSDWQNDRNFEYGKFTDARDFDYQQERNNVADEQWNKEFKYQQDRDKVADEQWDKTFGLEKSKFDWQKTTDERNYELEVSKEKTDKWYKEQSILLEKAAQKATTEYQKQQIELAKAELAEKKRQADLDYSIKKAELNETIRNHNLSTGLDETGKKKADSDSNEKISEWKSVKTAKSLTSSGAGNVDISFQRRGAHDIELAMADLMSAYSDGTITSGEAKYIAKKMYDGLKYTAKSENNTRMKKEMLRKADYVNDSFGGSLG